MFFSDISKLEFPDDQKVYASQIEKSIFQLIVQSNTSFTNESVLSIKELNEFRKKFISSLLSDDVDTLSELEKLVLNALHENKVITDDIDEKEGENFTFGQKLADTIASFGGSWTFICLFFLVLAIWISSNIYFFTKPFDPYPFILLNLILSCIAALQAPVIMMSQNRQEAKDRIRAKNDYIINLKSELEIRMLHEKVDHLILHQQKNLLETQQIQIQILNEILEKLSVK